jgi:hypothetical protein
VRKPLAFVVASLAWVTAASPASGQFKRPPGVVSGDKTYGLGALRGFSGGASESDAWDKAAGSLRTCDFADGDNGFGSTLVIDGRTDPVFVRASKACSDGTTIFGQFCVMNCPGAATRTTIVRIPGAREVLKQLVTPLPVPRFSPRLEDVTNSNLGGYLVGMPTYFAVEPASWKPVVGRPVVRGGYSMGLTANPVGLEIRINKEWKRCEGSGEIVTTNSLSASIDCATVFTYRGNVTIGVRVRYHHVYTPGGFTAANPPDPAPPTNEYSYSPVLTVPVNVVEVQPVIKTISYK